MQKPVSCQKKKKRRTKQKVLKINKLRTWFVAFKSQAPGSFTCTLQEERQRQRGLEKARSKFNEPAASLDGRLTRNAQAEGDEDDTKTCPFAY